jgi:hypothetical protein
MVPFRPSFAPNLPLVWFETVERHVVIAARCVIPDARPNGRVMLRDDATTRRAKRCSVTNEHESPLFHPTE